MKYAITEACEALEKVIEELKRAGRMAKLDGNRAAERNIGENMVEDISRVLYNLRYDEEWIRQDRYAKYFEEKKDENT
jgi:hypothetical protein